MKRNQNEILPIFNYEPATEIRAVKPESKVGQIIDRCSGDGAKASELLPSFVKKTGEPWLKTAIEGVFLRDPLILYMKNVLHMFDFSFSVLFSRDPGFFIYGFKYCNL